MSSTRHLYGVHALTRGRHDDFWRGACVRTVVVRPGHDDRRLSSNSRFFPTTRHVASTSERTPPPRPRRRRLLLLAYTTRTGRTNTAVLLSWSFCIKPILLQWRRRFPWRFPITVEPRRQHSTSVYRVRRRRRRYFVGPNKTVGARPDDDKTLRYVDRMSNSVDDTVAYDEFVDGYGISSRIESIDWLRTSLTAKSHVDGHLSLRGRGSSAHATARTVDRVETRPLDGVWRAHVKSYTTVGKPVASIGARNTAEATRRLIYFVRGVHFQRLI